MAGDPLWELRSRETAGTVLQKSGGIECGTSWEKGGDSKKKWMWKGKEIVRPSYQGRNMKRMQVKERVRKSDKELKRKVNKNNQMKGKWESVC